MNWDDVRVFLAVERAGTMAGAAQALGIDASTAGRRLARLEADIGAPLVERTAGGADLTATGEQVLAQAERLEEVALAIAASGEREAKVEGTVRLATAELLFISFLQPHLAELRERHPGLCLELTTSTTSVNLLKREADIALRPAAKRPQQQKVVVKKVATIGAALYASESYLARHGRPGEGGGEHDVIGYDRQFGSTTQTRWTDESLGDGRISFTANTMLSRAEACAAGWGLASLPCFVARRYPNLVTVKPGLPETPLWLLVHPDLRRSARVRVVLDHLTDVVRANAAELAGPIPE